MMTLLMVAPMFVVISSLGMAAEGNPLAIRKWPHGMLSIETNWGLQVVVSPTSTGGARPFSDRPADLALFADKHISGIVESNTVMVSGPNDRGAVEHINHHLTRQPNDSNVTWAPTIIGKLTTTNGIHVRTAKFDQQNTSGILLTVDGVRLLVICPKPSTIAKRVPDATEPDHADNDLMALQQADLMIVPASNPKDPELIRLSPLIKLLRPRAILLDQVSPSEADQLTDFITAIDSQDIVTQPRHNTLSLSTKKVYPRSGNAPVVLLLDSTPFEMPEPLAELFLQMEQSCKDSQNVFSKLSVNQMNFRPSNGTHTPRWNAEHMMGRHLLFFSQIYHALDPAIPVMDLNPAQMPDDYQAAHVDWDGKEEARQMQRVNEFCRRFAYLLDGIDLDQKAPGSSWTLRGLLLQMHAHYGEHTANTVRKFDLPDWPAE